MDNTHSLGCEKGHPRSHQATLGCTSGKGFVDAQIVHQLKENKCGVPVSERLRLCAGRSMAQGFHSEKVQLVGKLWVLELGQVIVNSCGERDDEHESWPRWIQGGEPVAHLDPSQMRYGFRLSVADHVSSNEILSLYVESSTNVRCRMDKCLFTGGRKGRALPRTTVLGLQGRDDLLTPRPCRSHGRRSDQEHLARPFINMDAVNRKLPVSIIFRVFTATTKSHWLVHLPFVTKRSTRFISISHHILSW